MQRVVKPWKEKYSPRRILVIRMHAIGDVVITLPYLRQLKNDLPALTTFDFLTISEAKQIPGSVLLFDHVYDIKGGRNFKRQFLFAILLLPKLFFKRYDVIIDLQNGIISRIMRRLLGPKAWSTFDKTSRIPAGERTQRTIEDIGLGKNQPCHKFSFIGDMGIEELLKQNGWNDSMDLVILNPAGAFETRNWHISNYTGFAQLWLQRFPRTQFLIMGLATVSGKANHLKQQLGEYLIDLVDKTSLAQAFAIVQKTKFVLSEDSGLMHMAWVSGIPTLALFGSTRSYWSTPLGKHTYLLSSDDLECGNCMLEVCKYGDTHCLTRYSPEMVFEKAIQLLEDCSKDPLLKTPVTL